MFKVAVQTGGLDERFGVDKAYQLIKEAGFDGVDANVNHLQRYGMIQDRVLGPAFSPELSEKEMLEYFRPFGEAAKKYGLDNYQAHAPYPSMITSDMNDPFNTVMMDVLKKTIVGCASIDCQNLTIHPFFCNYDNQMDRRTEWELNIARYSELAEVSKKYGVRINLENMFTGHKGKLYAACCNSGPEAAKYVDELNRLCGEDTFGFCMDTGHALIASLDIKQFLTDLGDRITCFHVHDNDGVHDDHQAPYTGKLDWDRFMEGLQAIGFDRTLSFETHNAVCSVPEELIPQTLQYICACGRLFSDKASKKE
ncbi:MAG: sugar phosphate isomerase/epimerase [Lachnospiraceae bacterium]|nr:sugar phosphate isomerase/epimerase [Lachnospiraceae bacterium]